MYEWALLFRDLNGYFSKKKSTDNAAKDLFMR